MVAVVKVNVETAQDYQDAAESAHKLISTKPAAEGTSLADITALAEAGKIAVDSKANTTERIEGTGKGGASYYLRDAVTSGARPAPNLGTCIHIGVDGLYWEGVFSNEFITLEQFAAVGDYNPATGIGTDCSPSIAAIKAANLGLPVRIRSGAKYKITEGIEIYSGMDWLGDFTCEFYPAFAASGKKMIKSPDSVHKNVSLKGITLVRIGTNAEHGGVVDALENATFHIRVISDGTATGGAFGVSAFYPSNRPSKNVNALIEVEKGGNFGLQYGNVSVGTMEVVSLGTQREALGLEPYALGRVLFTSIATNQITYPAHGMITGDPVIYSAQGNSVITGLANGGIYFAVVVDANTIKLAKTVEQAWVNEVITLGSVTGTQAVYRAGLAENITIKGVRNKTGDLVSAGSLTGIVIITATSGGYHRGIRASNINSELNNPTSGTQNINIVGAKNVVVTDCNLIGGTASVQATSGFLQDISSAEGNITPSPSLEVLPDCEILNNRITGASTKCIAVEKGRAVVKGNYTSSGITGAIGVYMTAAAEASGSYAQDNTADVPNGSAFSLRKGIANIDLNKGKVSNKYNSRSGTFFNSFAVNLLTTTNDVCGLTDSVGDASNYSGIMHITAKAVDAGNTETSSYVLNVVKKASGPAGELALINALGLVTGGGTTHPSFTFTISANRLIATPIGSTTQNRTWFFWISTIGDLVAN